ncbi:hypothetical protein FAM09_14535 [Niastella caeni]|uniref:Outer membrane protein beta-barrel domain-containing protein n=1 Tax=Niastella caeni TaxID=2569763 RepID=A0A4S8HVR9_9BACT|nr:hypothetical protein [Niastella caeni]THU39710.1 hypothetical protein FAM09_14535 [Niastella caeni]
MKTLCIRCILWVFSALFIQRVAQAQATTPTQAPILITTTEKDKQKKPKVKKQWRFAVDIDAGVASPNNADLSDIFKAGFNASIGVKTAFLKNKLWVRPLAGLKYYFKEVALGETQREAFRTWKGGIEIQYNAYTLKKFSFFPIFRVDQNMSSSQFTKIGEEKAATPGIETTDKVLTGSGISFDAGIMVVRSGDLYVKLDYEYYKPDLKVNPELVREMLAAGFIMPEHKVYNCSSINLSVGVNLNFKK